MKVEIVKPFRYAHDGIRIEEIQPGAIVDGDCAVQAVAGGWGRELGEELAPKAPQAAPLNRAARPTARKPRGS